MSSRTLNVFSDGSVKGSEYEPVFARMRHASQSPIYGYLNYMAGRFNNFKDGANDPAVLKYPFNNERYLVLDRERENWWYERLVEASQGSMTTEQLKTAWRNLVNPKKAFTNNRDLTVWGYILGGSNPKPLRLEPILSTGATIKLKGGPFKKGDGHWYHNFEVIDMLRNDYKTMTWETHWWVIQAATNSISIGTSGRFERIDPFPKMAGDRDTPYFLWGLGTTTAYIRWEWLEPIPYELAKPAYPYLPYRNRGGVERFDLRNMQ